MKRSELIFTGHISNSFSHYCQNHHIHEAVVIVDTHTEFNCLPLLDSPFPVICIPAGEPNKNLGTLDSILKKLIEYRADKQTVIFNLGGGMVSDIGGFAASVYKRGIRYVNIPTTLMGMVDAAIGGKTGVDYLNYKNYLGVFKLPEAVLVSEEFLKTLPAEELNSAWAEIIKTASVSSRDLMDLVIAGAPLGNIIAMCASCKEEITNKDFTDEHIRQLLNFGHTIGHAFESYRLSVNMPVMHGVAVAKGMIYETRLALKLGLISAPDAKLIIELVKSKMYCDELTENEFGCLQPFLAGDKKNSGGDIVFSLPTGIGQGTYGVKVIMEDIKI